MSVNGKNRMWLGIGLALVAVALVMMNRSHSAQEERGAVAGSGPRYTVTETQGFNLLVTDNTTNKLYYYATDKDAAVGAPMKLRASLDLTQVGKAEIKATHHNLEDIRPKEEKK